MKCVKCGADLLAEDRFCYKCGTKVVLETKEEKAAKREVVSESDRKAAFELGQQERVTKLVREFRTKRDMDSFEMLYQMEASDVFARAWMMLNSDADSKAVMQQVFGKVYTNIGQLKDDDGFERWLMSMTRRMCFGRLGDISRADEAFLHNEAICDERELEDSFVEFWPKNPMDQKEVAETLYKIMDTLPLAQRVCLQMREYDGLSYQEIADETGLPMSSVKNSVHGAKHIIKAKMLSERIDTTNPVGYFYWMLRQGSKVYGCEPSVAVAVWEHLTKTISGGKASGKGNGGPEPVKPANPPAYGRSGELNGNALDQSVQSRADLPGEGRSKTPIIIAVVAAVLVLGIGGFFVVRSLSASSSNRGEAKAGSEGEIESIVKEETDATEQDAVLNDVNASDVEEQTEDPAETNETAEFEPKDYMGEMTEDQKVKLYSILSAVADVTVPERAFWGEEFQTSTSADLDHLSVDPGEDLSLLAYDIAVSPGFYSNYQFLDEYQWETEDGSFQAQALVIPQGDMERILKTALDQDVPPTGHLMDAGMIHYDNGNYLGLILDGDWVYGYSGLLKMEQTAPDEVYIYGVSGRGNIHYYYERDYNPHNWNLIQADEYDEDYTTLVHTYSAKARINADSPCGLTILGIQYDDPESAKIAAEEGFTITKADAQSADASRDNTDEYYILPRSNKEKLKEEDLKALTPDQLRIARNEIYARYGRKFMDEELQAYFDKQPWYYGFIEPDSFTEDMLTDLERENAEILKKEEEKRKKGN
ncbi:MAG: sigma-70 family RNA polymerase sigma factor [Lachnospiraceae bacterium]|nr:sigma-70 family RNA polymerase sigma factor [Lachnospiraceae bacterium]